MSIMDFSGNINDFATGTYAVSRAVGPGEYNLDGVFEAEPETTVQVLAMVAPLSGRELQRLPEGLRTSETLQVFTVAELRVSAPGQRPDVIEIDGASWQVQLVERWAALGNYYRSVVSKVTDAE